MEKQPLVSVIVVSYNAEKTVLETLDSVLRQTYQNVELVLSDDCSKDNTVQVARKWFDEHSTAFKGGAYLLTAENNQGVCANFNKAIRSSHGEWIKIIAADDILLPNCCKDYVEYAQSHPDAQYITGLIDVYDEKFDDSCLMKRGLQPVSSDIYLKNVEEQLKIAASTMIISGAGIFYSRHLFDTIGGYDTKYPFEDWPSVISSLEAGFKVYLLRKSTVGYRYHDSLSNKSGRLFNIAFKRQIRAFFRERCFRYLDVKSRTKFRIQWAFEEFLDFIGLNRNNMLGRTIEIVLSRIKNQSDVKGNL